MKVKVSEEVREVHFYLPEHGGHWDTIGIVEPRLVAESANARLVLFDKTKIVDVVEPEGLL